VVIPKGGTASQIEQINKAVGYGSNRIITVNRSCEINTNESVPDF